MKKSLRLLFLSACAMQLALSSLTFAQEAAAPATVHPNSKEARKAARRAAALAEVKQLLSDITGETNKLADALNISQKGNEVVTALDVWATYLDGWKKRARSLERQKGFKFLKSAEPPEELKGDLEAFMASVTRMSEALQAKIELYKDNPKFQKRIQVVLGKLQDM